MRLIFLISLLLASCSADSTIFGPPSRFKHAAIHRSIAPWDGPAIVLLLSDTPIEGKHPKQTYVAIAIYEDGDRKPTDPVQIDGSNWRSGVVYWHELNKEQVKLEWAEVRFDKVSEESLAVGTFDIRMPDGNRETGSFKAKWLPSDGPGG